MIKGSCNCGAVTVEAKGAPKLSIYCHCDDCQKAYSAAAVGLVIFAADEVDVTGPVASHVLKTQPRWYCTSCGTRVMGEPKGMGVRNVPAKVLPDEAFEPVFHIQCQYARYPVKDELPHFKAFPAAFGGSDDKVPW